MLTVVMYHYVRPVRESAFPELKALEIELFLSQLDYLATHYQIISPANLRASLAGSEQLNANACLLTFDDGYSDHYHTVFPALRSRGLSGLFFAPAQSLLERQPLKVNKLQFVLASAADPEALATEIEAVLADDPEFDLEAMRREALPRKSIRYGRSKLRQTPAAICTATTLARSVGRHAVCPARHSR